MAWTEIAWQDHSRCTDRYPSDLLDSERRLIAPLFPATKRDGRPRTTDLREVMNAILYIASTGCQWRALPKEFPAMTTVQGYFYAGRDMGLFTAISHLFVILHAADNQDRDGAPALLKGVRHRFPWLRHVFASSRRMLALACRAADGGYAGAKLRTALRGEGCWTLDIIKRSYMAKGFEVLPRGWVVERTFACLGRCLRLAKDWETTIESATAWACIASIRMITRRIARLCNDS